MCSEDGLAGALGVQDFELIQTSDLSDMDMATQSGSKRNELPVIPPKGNERGKAAGRQKRLTRFASRAEATWRSSQNRLRIPRNKYLMAPLSSPLSIIMLNCKSIHPFSRSQVVTVYSEAQHSVSKQVTDKYLPTFLGYSTYWCNRDGRRGGLCILVNSSLCYQPLVLLPYPAEILEVQAISLCLRNATTISILNIYSPNGTVTLQELTSYSQQLTSPYLVVGDFNAHSPILSSQTNTPDATGRALEELLLTEPLILMNPVDFHTYIYRHTGSPGCLDLVLVTSDVSWFQSRTLARCGK